MSHRAVSNLILLGVIFVLGSLVIYTQYHEKPTQVPLLTDLKADQVQQIRIERQEEETLVLNKDSQGHWFLTEPLAIAAHAFRVDNLLRLLSTTHYQLVESDSIPLADLKLEPPLVRVTFNKWEVAFGDRSPLNDGRRYVYTNQKVYLLLDTIYSSLIDDVTTFINLSPLGQSPKVTELKLPDTHLILKDGFWHPLSIPPFVEDSADAISGLIENWQQAQAFAVKHYNAEETSSQGTITVTLQGQDQPLNFTIVATTPEFILALPEKGIQYHFSINQVERLLYLPKKAVKDEVGHATTS